MVWLTVLGIPAAVYVTSMTAIMFYINQQSFQPLFILGTALLTMGVYSLHRLSVVEVEPMQLRHKIAIKHRKSIRLASVLFLCCAVVVFALHQPLATLLVLGSILGMIVYGRETIIKPLRTVTILKPCVVGVSIAMFAWVLGNIQASLLALVALAIICSADAMVCDLVDKEYDAATGCTTMAKKLGDYSTWGVAVLLYLTAGMGIINTQLHSPIGYLFLVVFPIPLVFPISLRRTLIDVRPLLVLLLAWTI